MLGVYPGSAAVRNCDIGGGGAGGSGGAACAFPVSVHARARM